MTALFSLPENRAQAGPIRTSLKRYSVRRRWLAFRVSSVLVMLFEIEKKGSVLPGKLSSELVD
jgi:hypothetical protein